MCIIKRLNLLFTGLALLGLLAVPAAAQTTDVPCIVSTACFDLFAGQHILAGQVCVSIVGGTDLRVEFDTSSGPCLIDDSIKVWVGTDPTGYPQNKQGSPIPGQFPHKSEGFGQSATASVLIDLAGLGFSCPSSSTTTFYMLAHADLTCFGGTSSETGWSFGGDCNSPTNFQLPGANWATYSCFSIGCCPPTTGFGTETAFAKGDEGTGPMTTALCFLDVPKLNTNRWGWTNGAIGSGLYSWRIYAGAGQCTGGTYVGDLVVDYDCLAGISVNYVLFPGFTLLDSHLYVGLQDIPINPNNNKPSVAPGQYPYSNQTGIYLIPAPATCDPVFVIAHAVVGGVF